MLLRFMLTFSCLPLLCVKFFLFFLQRFPFLKFLLSFIKIWKWRWYRRCPRRLLTPQIRKYTFPPTGFHWYHTRPTETLLDCSRREFRFRFCNLTPFCWS